jgi:hypothetical protein
MLHLLLYLPAVKSALQARTSEVATRSNFDKCQCDMNQIAMTIRQREDYFMTPDITQIAKQNFDTLAAIQKEVLDALAKANQEWMDCAKQEAKLTSTLAQKVTTAKSIPEATAACQEWASQQIDLISGQAKKAFDETQNLTKTYAQIVNNGKRD